MDVSKLNLQPLIDLLGKAGSETTEFQHARSAGRAAMAAWILGALGLIASAVADACGHASTVGAVAGIVVTAVGVISQMLVSLGYSASRADAKDAAAAAVTGIAAMSAVPAPVVVPPVGA